MHVLLIAALNPFGTNGVFYQECSFKTGVPFEPIHVLEMVEGEK